MSTLTFVAENGGNIGYVRDAGAPVAIETNVGLLNETAMRRRLLCDIIKDAVTKSPLSTEQCKHIIRHIYCNGNIVSEPNVDLSPSPFNQTHIHDWFTSAYETLLARLEKILDNDDNIKAKTTELINQPKLSTVGSNTKISDAEHVFWESGFGSELIMRSKGYSNILTPAAIMDPLGKEAATAYFPPANLNIVFDKTFTKRLGFPDTMWRCFSGVVQIQYTQLKDLDQVVLSHQFSETTTKEDVKTGQFAEYIKGNKEKNADILKYTLSGFNFNPEHIIVNIKNKTVIMEIIKILETKELGDVAQVWLYLAYLIQKDLLAQRETALMITTDSVVYLFCQLLNLSCAYTGSRAGVESKNCSIYHYVAGEPNYQLKISNMLTNAYDIVAQKIVSQKFILELVVADETLSRYWYMRVNRNKLVDKQGYFDETTINSPMDDNRKQKTREFFRLELAKLVTNQTELEEIKRQIFDYLEITLHTNDTEVMNTFKMFSDSISAIEYKQYFTRVKALVGEKLLLHDEFRNILYPNWDKPVIGGGLKGGSSIDEANYMINEISEEKIYLGGELNNRDTLSLLEATLLIFTYLKLKEQRKIEKLVEFDFDNNEESNEVSLFAMTYDMVAYNVDDVKYKQAYNFICNKPFDIVDPHTYVDPDTYVVLQIKLNDESIIQYGAILRTYVYFADDLSVVFPKNSVGLAFIEASSRATRSMHLPIFVPSTYCDGTHDAYTRVKIPIGTGMEIYGLCYSAHTIIKLIITINESNPGILFIPLFEQLFQGLFDIFKKQTKQTSYPIVDYFKSDIAHQVKFIEHLRNIFAFMFTFYRKLYVSIQSLIPNGSLDISHFTYPNIRLILKVENFLIKFDIATQHEQKFIFGGSNKYLLKKIKSKKNRVKKVKSKKNRVKKIKSKQRRLKKIKSKKFTRKNKKSKNGVI